MSKRGHGETSLESMLSQKSQKHKYISKPIGLGRKLAGIMAELEPLSEQHGFMKFLNNVDHADTLNGFVQDLALAITDYQVCCTNLAEQAV